MQIFKPFLRYSQILNALQLYAHPKRSVRNEKPGSEKQLGTPISGSQTSQNKPSAVGSPTRDSSPCRTELKLSNENDKSNRSLDEQNSHLTNLVEKLTTSVKQLLSRNQVQPSSPVPRGRPFERIRSLSRSPARAQRFPSPINS